eukprot:CAMPEP_0194029486 /NCGR_PEP_ID=MMETSP0009_2-20130614/3193_1 /TAXON_ID=210454 /ORGANISM="Grammatophora oceanica, Strain CCMP 410" /LENGTH=403 /DNA_ID=CAMNT_0038669161 /DNA_START=165 /DNA_END=1376 /DNA_ORIENTATION=-
MLSNVGIIVCLTIWANLAKASTCFTATSVTPEMKAEGTWFSICPRSWDFRGHHIGYEEAARAHPETGDADHDVRKEPILLLNGFGVGSFHQHRLMPQLLQYDDRAVYGIDYLGQGRSWPVDCQDGNSENEKDLIYSADTWVEQIVNFIDEVILPKHNGIQKIHLVGNSVGGYLSVAIARRRPDLIASVTLLNATPVWGLNAPGWSGHLPPPALPRKIGRFLFDKIRDLETIDKYLEAAYSNNGAFSMALSQQIRGCTVGNGGHAAFASILWSPPATFPGEVQDWFRNLGKLDCDVLLIFGAADPWCKPAFAKKMIKELSNREALEHRYLELSNVGHCPNHEAPTAVGKAVSKWVSAHDRGASLALVDGPQEVFQEHWGEIAMREKSAADIPVGLIDRLAVAFV